MFFILSKLFWLLVQPLVAIAVMLGAALVATSLARPRAAAILYVLAGLSLVLAAFTPAGLLMTAFLENRFERPALPESVAGIIVLGGAIDTRVARTRNVVELNDAADRLTAALILARRYPRAKLLFSGGVAAVLEDDVPEVDAAGDFFTSLGLERDRLLLEGRARNTFENAVFSKRLADPKPGETWLLVTSAYHMPRAVGSFRVAGFDVLPYPVDYRTPAGPVVWRPSSHTVRNLEKVHFALREYIGLVAYRLTGRTDALLPEPTANRSAG